MSLVPPKREQVQDLGRVNWHTVFPIQFSDLVAAGYVDGADVLSFGSTITGLSTSDNEVAFREGTALAYPAALSADTVYAVSSAVGDTDTYTVHGIDANGDFATAEVTLTGTTPATVPGTWNHVQRIVNSTAGTVNAGNVFVSTDAAAVPTTLGDQIQCVALAGDNYGINPELQCPNDRIILIHRFDFSTDTDNDTKIRILANRQGTWILNFLFYCGLDYHQEFLVPVRLFPGDKLRVTIEADVGTSVNAGFGMNGYVFSDTRANDTKIAGGIGQLYNGVI